MRILLAGATGVLGRATLPHLRTHEVLGLTRSPEGAQRLKELGAEGVVCDVFDHGGLAKLARRFRPEIVVNFVTDLRAGSPGANNRARRVGGQNLLKAAEHAKASRLVVESVAFTVERDATEAVTQLERGALGFAGEALILRFGRLWGPDTFHDTPPEAPSVHIDKAGAEAARLLVEAPAGTYIVT